MRALERIRSRLSSLSSETQERAETLLILAADQGLALRVTQTLRSLEVQAALYAQGRETFEEVNRLRREAGLSTLAHPGRNFVVTGARPGRSWHNFGRAIDVVPMEIQDETGRLVCRWGSPSWGRLGELGESLGFVWGGRWRRPDRPHFEFHPGLSLDDMGRDGG